MNTDSSLQLVNLVKAGDAPALERLLLRYLPRLRCWAHRRLPAWARRNNDTEDLVQETLVNAARNLRGLRMQHAGSLRTYMRRALENRINDEIRRAHRCPPTVELAHTLSGDDPSELERVISREDLARCRAALARLSAADREILMVRLTRGDVSFRTLASLTGKPSEDAARVALARAVRRLALEMERLEACPL
ncbi:MAG: sigma-70 family RNA polymerase sigma factor [Chloroflexia bacterium]|nr:sigma-70 family RNA polymerase sigma factor [Chloroflexia bacterium]MBA3639565.1 sigma-70 family RNA polymerase sigma factor [Acidobacteriota bacterium]